MSRGTARVCRWAGLGLALGLLVGSLGVHALGQPFLLPIRFQFQLPHAIFASSLTDLSIVIGREQTFFVKETKAHWRNWDSTLNLRFMWTSSQPGIASAIYQVSTIPFSADASQILDPPGLVASGPAGEALAAGDRQVFTIDLRAFAPVPPGETRPSSSATATAPTFGPIVRMPALPSPAVRAMPGFGTSSPPPSSYLTVVQYSIRVVTLGPSGMPVGIPSPPVTVTYGELPPDEGSSVPYYGQQTLNHPSVAVTGYVPIQKEDPQAIYHYVVIRDIHVPMFGTLFYEGEPLDFSPQEDDEGFWESLWDSISEAFSDITSFFKSAVNWCATAYEDMKAYAIDAAVVVAGEDARGLLTVGLEIGLAAMGIPPSLPNYDELTGMGKDYLVQAAADAAGLPPEVAAVAVDAFLDEATRQANGGGNPNIWFKPDPRYTYRPAYFTVIAGNPTGQTTDPVYTRIKVHVPAVGNAELFHSAYAYIPSLDPWETIPLRVYLEENYALRDPGNPFAGESYYAGMQRFWSYYNNHPASISVITTGAPNTANPTLAQQQIVLSDCRIAQSF